MILFGHFKTTCGLSERRGIWAWDLVDAVVMLATEIHESCVNAVGHRTGPFFFLGVSSGEARERV